MHRGKIDWIFIQISDCGRIQCLWPPYKGCYLPGKMYLIWPRIYSGSHLEDRAHISKRQFTAGYFFSVAIEVGCCAIESRGKQMPGSCGDTDWSFKLISLPCPNSDAFIAHHEIS